MSRLTDEELNGLQADVDAENPDQPIRRRVARALSELRARRAAELTAEEVEALAVVRDIAKGAYEHAISGEVDPDDAANVATWQRALSVLDKLTRSKP